MDPEDKGAGLPKVLFYWREQGSPADLLNRGFYSAGWFSAFESLGARVDRKTDDAFFSGFVPGEADWHVYLAGTPVFVEGGDFRTFTPPREGKTALILEEDIHYKLHHLLLLAQSYTLLILHDWLTYLSLQAAGVRNAFWVPAAYDPGSFKPMKMERALDVAFLGSPGAYYHRRGFVRDDFVRHLHRLPDERKVLGCGFYGPDANTWYNKAKIVLDLPTYENVGPRVMQVLGSGRFLLMNRLRNVPMATTHGLVEGVHFDAFDGTIENLDKKIQWYVTHPEEREKIAKQAHAEAPRFTYGAVASKILERMMVE
jgi:hypothetical protein